MSVRLRWSPWWAAIPITLWVLACAADLLLQPRHDVIDAIPDTLRALTAAIVFFGACGLGVTRLLLPASLRHHEALWVLPTGACASGLALMVLGFCGVPFVVNLIVVCVAGAALSVVGVRRHGWPVLRGPALAWPTFLGLVTIAVAVTPMVVEDHFATVTGTGSDAHMAAGSANFLQHAYPTGHDASLPVDRMPLLWKSKYPIYYAFGAVAKLSGLETWQTLVPLVAVLLALAALGMYLLARDLLGAGVGVSACAMGFAGLDRMVLHTGLNPYFNQTWGYLAMPFTLVLGWWLVKPGEPPEERRRTAILLLIFIGVCALAYPLALPIAAMPLVVLLWRERRRRIAEGQPVPRLRSLYKGPRSLLWIVPAVLILFIPVGGAIEKLNSAAGLVLDPNRTLIAWAADLRAFIPMTSFINLPDNGLAALVMGPIVFFAFRELRRHQPRALYIGLGLVLVVGLFEAAQFRNRSYGFYFHFKILAFIAPLLLVIATVHLGRRRWGPWVLAAFAVATGLAVREELRATGRQLGMPTIELASWARELPRDASIRLDMSGGQQLWGAYFLASRRVCAEEPLESDYPRVAKSTKADYVLVASGYKRPAEALGPALEHSDGYDLYRMNPAVGGRDRCSREQNSRVTQAKISGK